MELAGAEKTVIRFTVPGQAVPKQSFRYVHGKKNYIAKQVRAWQDTVGWMAKAYRPREILHGPLGVELKFYLKGRRRVDLDNLCKGVLDGMRKIVYEDDSQIVELHIYKYLTEDEARVEIAVWCIDEKKEGE